MAKVSPTTHVLDASFCIRKIGSIEGEDGWEFGLWLWIFGLTMGIAIEFGKVWHVVVLLGEVQLSRAVVVRFSTLR